MMEPATQDLSAIGISQPGKQIIKAKINTHSVPDIIQSQPVRKQKIKDAISWAISFAVVAAVTGALMVYHIGVTMYNVTSILFYIALLGVLAFIAKAIHIKRVE